MKNSPPPSTPYDKSGYRLRAESRSKNADARAERNLIAAEQTRNNARALAIDEAKLAKSAAEAVAVAEGLAGGELTIDEAALIASGIARSAATDASTRLKAVDTVGRLRGWLQAARKPDDQADGLEGARRLLDAARAPESGK